MGVSVMEKRGPVLFWFEVFYYYLLLWCGVAGDGEWTKLPWKCLWFLGSWNWKRSPLSCALCKY
ncbi:hypothetical protein HanRHA438_Chr03g0124581 [Helianthus annuus]|nr:hypothetical protein HanRHA438_Chr03g0124581 [Helianthus annuus]